MDQLEAVADRYGTSADRLRRRIVDLFGRENLAGLRILDVGAGSGRHACALAAMGARSVVALEPEGDGSSANMIRTFLDTVRDLRLDNVELHTVTLEQHAAEPASFDCILMNAVINHLDEDCVQSLHHDPESRAKFAALLQPLLGLLRPGGELVAYDSVRTHALTPLLRLGLLRRHPLHPSIEWHKHQNPDVWSVVLRQAGFESVDWHWASLTRPPALRHLGGNRLVNSFVFPAFVLRARKSA